MGSVPKYQVKLSEQDQEALRQLVSRGEGSSRVIRGAQVLMASDDKGDEAVSEALKLARSSVPTIRKRFVNEGLEVALQDKPRPGAQPKLDARAEAQLIFSLQRRTRS